METTKKGGGGAGEGGIRGNFQLFSREIKNFGSTGVWAPGATGGGGKPTPILGGGGTFSFSCFRGGRATPQGAFLFFVKKKCKTWQGASVRGVGGNDRKKKKQKTPQNKFVPVLTREPFRPSFRAGVFGKGFFGGGPHTGPNPPKTGWKFHRPFPRGQAFFFFGGQTKKRAKNSRFAAPPGAIFFRGPIQKPKNPPNLVRARTRLFFGGTGLQGPKKAGGARSPPVNKTSEFGLHPRFTAIARNNLMGGGGGHPAQKKVVGAPGGPQPFFPHFLARRGGGKPKGPGPFSMGGAPGGGGLFFYPKTPPPTEKTGGVSFREKNFERGFFFSGPHFPAWGGASFSPRGQGGAFYVLGNIKKGKKGRGTPL